MVPIRNSAKAPIIGQDRLLTIELHDESGPLFVLPGGGQESGEDLAETVRRECFEELGAAVLVHELRFVREHIHPAEHRVEFIFRCSLPARLDRLVATRPDAGQRAIVWLSLAELPNLRFYPLGLRSVLGRAQAQEAAVYLGDIE